MATRIGLWLFSFVVVASVVRSSTDPNVGSSVGFKAGETRSVATQSNPAVFDINCVQEGESPDAWILVVGCLGDPLTEHSVRISSEVVTGKEAQSFTSLDLKTRLQDLDARFGASFGMFPQRHLSPQPSVGNVVEASSGNERRLRNEHRLIQGSPAESGGALSREFSIHVTDGPLDDAKHYVSVHANSIARNERVNVFLDEQVNVENLADGFVEQLTSEFDVGVVASMEQRFGRVRDVDGDGRFAVLLSPWLSRLQGGAVSLKGFVRSSDFRNNHPVPFSNHADVLYLNSNLRPGRELETLLAHEFTHAIVCDCQAQCISHEEDDWLNEGLAHVSETRFAKSLSNLGHRIARFQNDTTRCPLVVPDYYAAGMWRHDGCRGATWSFFNWLRSRYGDESIDALIQSEHVGVVGVEHATGVRFADLFMAWSVSEFTKAADGRDHEFTVKTADSSRTDPQAFSGPRVVEWDLTDKTLSLRGTTFAGIRITEPGNHRIRVVSDRGTDMQVSLVPVRNKPAFVSGLVTDSTQ